MGEGEDRKYERVRETYRRPWLGAELRLHLILAPSTGSEALLTGIGTQVFCNTSAGQDEEVSTELADGRRNAFLWLNSRCPMPMAPLPPLLRPGFKCGLLTNASALAHPLQASSAPSPRFLTRPRVRTLAFSRPPLPTCAPIAPPSRALIRPPPPTQCRPQTGAPSASTAPTSTATPAKQCPHPTPALKTAECRSFRYCTRECQRADWAHHKKFCEALRNNVGVSGMLQADGYRRHGRGLLLCEMSCKAEEYVAAKDVNRAVHRRIRSSCVPESGFAALKARWEDHELLYAYEFGGVWSLLQADGYRPHGRGLLFCGMSCKAEEYIAAKDVNRPVHRRIRSSYVPKSGFPALEARWVDYEARPLPVERTVETTDTLDGSYPGQIFVMVISCPFDPVQKYQAFLMANWLHADHPAVALPTAAMATGIGKPLGRRLLTRLTTGIG
ncbi:hypothetical protein BDK51DRAFT_43488 [Blyttiomyces helicus]|uniref:MYND-type domain-containing protein n=1 Tax=Blyttiomyces helicus TaxID=388810 RepID=A0A4P9W2N2_9FUNG|nr:hypothetical protein BDK51DRAFT_43488 [Blyttiomyces helicus]|eukprot:RKO86404.1 hypothetical protein BDK51DRAFT_43488 [Blyttiomyces helicus]